MIVIGEWTMQKKGGSDCGSADCGGWEYAQKRVSLLEPSGSANGTEIRGEVEEVTGEVRGGAEDETDTYEDEEEDGKEKPAREDDCVDSVVLLEILEGTTQGQHLVMFRTILFPLVCDQ